MVAIEGVGNAIEASTAAASMPSVYSIGEVAPGTFSLPSLTARGGETIYDNVCVQVE